MPYAQTVNTVTWDEGSATWVPGPQVLLTKNSFSHAAAYGTKTQVWMSDGTFIMVNQELSVIEAFLNS